MAMSDRMKRVAVTEQDPVERAKNFKEVCLGYDNERAVKEASRCLHCKNPKCVEGCPVSINIPEFINYIKDNDIEGAAKEIAKYSSLPAVCGRVCPQESQCEGKCVLGIKGEPLAIGKLEKYAADWARENYVDVSFKEESNNIKVAIIGSGPAGLTCAGDLAKKGYDVTIFEALHEPGGVLVYGIPEFRLPKEEVVKAEIDNIRKLGVNIETNVIGDDNEYLIPIASIENNNVYAFKNEENENMIVQREVKHFNYYRVKNGTHIISKHKAYYGCQIPLKHDAKRKNLS